VSQRIKIPLINKYKERIKAIKQTATRYTIHTCGHFGECGGCLFRDIPYKKQLGLKQKQIADACAEINHPKISTIIPSPSVDYYRNKMEYAFGVWDESLVLGLRARKKFYKVVDVKKCRLQSAKSGAILATVRAAACRLKIPAYHRGRSTGILRYAVVREGKKTGSIMVNLITSPVKKDSINKLLDEVFEKHPTITSLLWSVTTTRSDVAIGETTECVQGSECIEEKIGKLLFRISPYSFFQTNSDGAAVLYETIKKYAAQAHSRLLLDIYCGGGGIGLYCADMFDRVIGFEVNQESVSDALLNMKINNIKNSEFICSRARDIHQHRFQEKFSKITAIVDPPRSGLNEELITFLCTNKPAHLIYVSCNPKALSRDLQRLAQFYKISGIQPIDLFPHTPHIETVAALQVVNN